jgi:hypothetical protein
MREYHELTMAYSTALCVPSESTVCPETILADSIRCNGKYRTVISSYRMPCRQWPRARPRLQRCCWCRILIYKVAVVWASSRRASGALRGLQLLQQVLPARPVSKCVFDNQRQAHAGDYRRPRTP